MNVNRTYFAAIGLVVVLLLIAGLSFAGLIRIPFPSFLSGLNKQHFPEGKIYLSLAPVSAGDQNAVGIYTFDVETETLSQLLADDNYGYIAGSLSSDGKKLVFSRFSRSSLHDPE